MLVPFPAWLIRRINGVFLFQCRVNDVIDAINLTVVFVMATSFVNIFVFSTLMVVLKTVW
jgi:hypothetical protein